MSLPWFWTAVKHGGPGISQPTPRCDEQYPGTWSDLGVTCRLPRFHEGPHDYEWPSEASNQESRPEWSTRYVPVSWKLTCPWCEWYAWVNPRGAHGNDPGSGVEAAMVGRRHAELAHGRTWDDFLASNTDTEQA